MFKLGTKFQRNRATRGYVIDVDSARIRRPIFKGGPNFRAVLSDTLTELNDSLKGHRATSLVIKVVSDFRRLAPFRNASG